MPYGLLSTGFVPKPLTVIKSDLRTSVGRFDSLGIKDPNTRKAFELRPEDEVYSSVFH